MGMAISHTHILVRVGRFGCIFFLWEENRGVAPSSRREQRSSALHIDFRISDERKSRGQQKLYSALWSEWGDSLLFHRR